MNKTMKWKEAAAVLSVVLSLVGLPLLLWHWKAVASVDHYAPGTKLITLTAVADGGYWTEEEVVGHNYWRGQRTRTEGIPLQQGDHVVLHLRSADVLHTFAIPLLRLGPVDVPAGHTVEMEFDADRAGTLTFLCWQVCSLDHPHIRGRFEVAANEEAQEEAEEEEGW